MPTFSSGFQRDVLLHLSSIAMGATPSMKMTVSGFLEMLLMTRRNNQLTQNIDNGTGALKSVSVKYKERGIDSSVVDTDDCDVDVITAFKEKEVFPTLFSKLGIFISVTKLEKYTEDAVTTVRAGKPATVFMQDFLDDLITQSQALVSKMDKLLLAKQALNFGINQVTGSAATTTVNIDQDKTVNDLTTGLTKILADAMYNEMSGPLHIVGSGLFNNYNLQQAVNGLAQNGVDTSRFTGYKFHNDMWAQAAWGINQIGIFEEGSVKLVEASKIGLLKPELTPGPSQFFTMPLPVQGQTGLLSVDFDVQLKFIDCPTEVLVNGVPTVVDRGWLLMPKKLYDLFNLPDDAYNAADRLTGNNGTLRYTITNS